jgi:hypothetical protein
MKEIAMSGDMIEDKRLKKRQRKQEKTRKMQSKLTYQPMMSLAFQGSNFSTELLPPAF